MSFPFVSFDIWKVFEATKVVFYSAALAENIQVFLSTLPSYVQYQNEKACSANKELFYTENFLKK